MNGPEDEDDGFEKAWPFEQVMKVGLEGARLQRRRLQAYVTENNPRLAAALSAEETRFDAIVRTVIEPAMRDFAEQVALSGWHVSVVRDDDLDRLDIFATPGIRFYCSRRPPSGTITDLIWPPCFIALYGCAQSKSIRTYIELSEIDNNTAPICGDPLEYNAVTSKTVHALLTTFMADLERSARRTRLP